MKLRIKEKFKKALTFLKEVRAEMKKINWLSLKETIRYTFIVVFVAVFVAAFLGGVDFLFVTFLNKFIR